MPTRIQTFSAVLLITSLQVSALASAQTAPPPNEAPPAYTPPPPSGGYNAPPSYSAPPGPPPPMAPARSASEVRFQPDEPDVELLSMSGSMPVERIHHWHHGWWGGYAVGYGWAPTYAPVCVGPCARRFLPGPYHLALSKGGGPVVPAYGPAYINGPSLIRGSYVDRSGLRTAGWIIGISGLVGGIVMIAASAHEEDVCDSDGYCYSHETADAPLLVGGIGVLLASGIVGGVLASQHDEAHISIEPLRLSSYGRLRESLAAMGAEAHPEGLALALHF